MAKPMLSAARVRELFDYDSTTGTFTRRTTTWNNRWKAGQVAGCRCTFTNYVLVCIDGRLYRAHRLAWLYVYGVWPPAPHEIDHIDMVRHNNAISNLRLVDRSGNNQNRGAAQSNNKSGFLGVHKRKTTGKWTAKICIDGKETTLGTSFPTPEQAHAAYLAEKLRIHPFQTIVQSE